MALPPRNEVELTRDRLFYVLEYLSTLIPLHFPRPLRLVVHGGACMLLHHGLHDLAQRQAKLTPTTPPRQTTRDVDYIDRSFATELFQQQGIPDASQKLQLCIHQTAMALKLGADWMNSDADIALPMATAPNGKRYDPIYDASIQKNNVDLHTIFTSKNGKLTLVSVAPFWAVALKLVRYTKWDPGDICLLLKYGTFLSGTQWTADMLERWLTTYCWTMGYAHYDSQRRADMHKRINHAIQMVWCSSPTTKTITPDTEQHALKKRVSADTAMGVGGLDKAHAEWGGGDRSGWEATFEWNWTKANSPPRQIGLHQQQLSSSPQPSPAMHTHHHPVVISHSAIPPPPQLTTTTTTTITSPPPASNIRHHHHQRSSISHLSPPPQKTSHHNNNTTHTYTHTRQSHHDSHSLLLPQNIAEWRVEDRRDSRSRSRGKSSHSRRSSPNDMIAAGRRRDVSREPAEVYVPPMVDSDYENSDQGYGGGYGYNDEKVDYEGQQRLLSVPGGVKTRRHKSSHSHSIHYPSPSPTPPSAPLAPYPGLNYPEDFDRQLGSLLYQSSRAGAHHQHNHHHHHHHHSSSSSSSLSRHQPQWRVGDVAAAAAAIHKSKATAGGEKRRKKEKKRDRDRDRDRDSKWSMRRLGSGFFGGGGGDGGTIMMVGGGRGNGSNGSSSESGSESESESGSEDDERPVIPGMVYPNQPSHHHQQSWMSSPLLQPPPPAPARQRRHGHGHGHGHTTMATTTTAAALAAASAVTGVAAVGVASSPSTMTTTTTTTTTGVIPQQFRHMVHPHAHGNNSQNQSGMVVMPESGGGCGVAAIQPHLNALGLY